MAATRKLLLGLALVATVVASVVDFPATETVAVGPQQPRSSAPPSASAVQAPAGSALQPVAPPTRFGAASADLFAVRSWQAPAPRLAVSAPASATAPPPLPFRYLGKLVQEGAVIAFLSQGTLTHLARKGDVLAGYRVDEVTASDMTFTHLQRNERQRLTFGSTP